ncbi:hypothetical protein A2Z33_06545 [Candidatus Gottesmanbacteria bacterium RBG_16_52_11]|uniref:riboflavin kinase n=1 Tax=Candidatus Gottesmanbacteria bacterium RBG_16_52_11 TaxID=1798374 RepID=A0A1F5YY84_9BACT|nr:MAG: hypothetical protein A2Z33_06545 [Candidatus Gottesmanbacteria bacterium RBG_16_52_11]
MNTSPFFIMVAASLWAVDGIIRANLTSAIPAGSIVFWEHVAGLFVLLPLLPKITGVFDRLNLRDWLLIGAATFVSSVAGTILYTQALRVSAPSGDFITPLVLQKIQPVIVIFLSVIILKERLNGLYVLLAPVALAGSYIMSFGFSPVIPQFAGRELTFILSIGAAAAWGSGTILSKTVLYKLRYHEFTVLRFILAIPMAYAVSVLLGQWTAPSGISFTGYLLFILIALTTGATALLIYFRGLRHTDASVATIAELIFPLLSIVIGITSLNPYGAPQQLSGANILGITMLLASVILINLQYARQSHISLITGRIVRGKGDGRKIGYRTANIAAAEPVPVRYGVYAARARIGDSWYEGVLHYGPRAVFGEDDPRLEIHFFNTRTMLYGKKITVYAYDFIRTTRFFPSLRLLTQEIGRDIIKAKAILKRRRLSEETARNDRS